MTMNDHIHTVVSGDGVVQLDLDEDVYYCRYEDQSAAACQRSGGIEQESVQHWAGLPAIKVPIRSRDIVQFVVILCRTIGRFKGKAVKTLIAAVQDEADERSTDTIRLIVSAATFDRLIQYMPGRSECLFRSYFLLEFLKARGLRADWVFAVHLFPFRGHCWVCHGNLLLNERPHRIETYQPILVAKTA